MHLRSTGLVESLGLGRPVGGGGMARHGMLDPRPPESQGLRVCVSTRIQEWRRRCRLGSP